MHKINIYFIVQVRRLNKWTFCIELCHESSDLYLQILVSCYNYLQFLGSLSKCHHLTTWIYLYIRYNGFLLLWFYSKVHSECVLGFNIKLKKKIMEQLFKIWDSISPYLFIYTAQNATSWKPQIMIKKSIILLFVCFFLLTLSFLFSSVTTNNVMDSQV